MNTSTRAASGDRRGSKSEGIMPDAESRTKRSEGQAI